MPAHASRGRLPKAGTSGSGFTLIEAAIAILVIAILAGAMAPLANRALDQQREGRTRDLLKQAFEACFGSRDRRVANMRADFGFDPTASLSNLSVMLNRGGTSWSSIAAYGNTYSFLSGWNGPYWTGPVNGSNHPVDGWGRTIQLVITSGAYQVVSPGPDGIAGSADDLVFPTVAVPYLAHNATVTLQVTKTSANITGGASLSFVYGTSPSSTTRCTPNLASAPAVGSLASPVRTWTNVGGTYQFNVPAGAVYLSIAPTGAGSFTSANLALDLLPGENRTVQVTL